MANQRNKKKAIHPNQRILEMEMENQCRQPTPMPGNETLSTGPRHKLLDNIHHKGRKQQKSVQ